MLVWRKVCSERWSDSWQERLVFAGPQRLVITRFGDSRRVRLEVFDISESLSRVLLHRFGGEVRTLAHSTASWVKSVNLKKPISFRGRLFLVNAEKPIDPELERRILRIPASLAFGTGEHATTSTCLRWLCDLAPAGRPWRFLDIGTGTGILAIGAAKLEASGVTGFDSDPTAVRIARENAILNGVSSVRFFRQDVLRYQAAETFDIVAANLYSEILARASERIWAALAPQGFCLVSGILKDQTESVLAAIRRLNAQIIATRARGKWVTILARKGEDLAK
jgi:ribosomal protein L11 methyltransferase